MDFSLEWLGGFFDGEGSVSIAHTPNGRKVDGITTFRTFRLMTAIGQKNDSVLYELVRRFGGRVHSTQSCRQWLAQSKTAANFLRTILPYLHIKKRVAEIGLEFVTLKPITSPGKRAAAMELRNELMRLNAID